MKTANSIFRQRRNLLDDLGISLRIQGRYHQAKSAFEESLKIADQLSDLGGKGLALAQLGRLAVEQKEWTEAERCYRMSLTMYEQQDSEVNAIVACNQLAIVARGSGRPTEAEGWYKRTLELDELIQPGSPLNASHFSNLADLLLSEVGAGHFPKSRLAEARDYAERSLIIREKLADLEERTEESRNYRRRERETYAVFEGNRYHIDRQHGQLIATIVAAAKGDTQARAKVEANLPGLEAKGWHIADATRRMWAGERDWHSLAEGVDSNSALSILRVLETIAQPDEAQSVTPEQVIASLPVAIREAMERGDQAAVEKAFEALSVEEQLAVMEAIEFLQGQQVEGDDEDKDVAESGE